MKFMPITVLALLPLCALAQEITMDNVHNLKRGLALASSNSAPTSLEQFESILVQWEQVMSSEPMEEEVDETKDEAAWAPRELGEKTQGRQLMMMMRKFVRDLEIFDMVEITSMTGLILVASFRYHRPPLL